MRTVRKDTKVGKRRTGLWSWLSSLPAGFSPHSASDHPRGCHWKAVMPMNGRDRERCVKWESSVAKDVARTKQPAVSSCRAEGVGQVEGGG